VDRACSTDVRREHLCFGGGRLRYILLGAIMEPIPNVAVVVWRLVGRVAPFDGPLPPGLGFRF